MKKNIYNSYLLCASSCIYLFAAAMIFAKNPRFAWLLLIVAVFSILYHKNFRNLGFKAFDWVFGLILGIYVYSLFGVKFDGYLFVFLIVLFGFRLTDHILFKTKRYSIFNYTHSLWHVVTAVAVTLLFVL